MKSTYMHGNVFITLFILLSVATSIYSSQEPVSQQSEHERRATPLSYSQQSSPSTSEVLACQRTGIPSPATNPAPTHIYPVVRFAGQPRPSTPQRIGVNNNPYALVLFCEPVD